MQDLQTQVTPDPAGVRSVAPGKRRILVVDDDRDVLLLNLETLSGHGYHVETANDGAMAWERMQLNRYDLLVTDNNMPKVTGFDLIKKVRAAHMALPVIMATGHPPGGFHQLSMQPATVLFKPYTIPDLLCTVEMVLRAHTPASEPIAPPTRENQQIPEGSLL